MDRGGRQDRPRTLANPLVAGEFGLQFYSASLSGHPTVTISVCCAFWALSPEGQVNGRSSISRISRRSWSTSSSFGWPPLDGLELAAEYRPASRERVDGDFYHAFETPEGYGLLIGDACGHGPRAAALTSMARHSLVTVSTDWEPLRVLADLNAAVLVTPEDDPRRFCTVALLRCHRDGSAVAATIALGGHPYPRILRADGSVEVVGEGGSLVGVFASATFTDTALRLAPDDALVLYTDGLVEAEASAEHHESQLLYDVLATMKGASAAVLVVRNPLPG